MLLFNDTNNCFTYRKYLAAFGSPEAGMDMPEKLRQTKRGMLSSPEITINSSNGLKYDPIPFIFYNAQ